MQDSKLYVVCCRQKKYKKCYDDLTDYDTSKGIRKLCLPFSIISTSNIIPLLCNLYFIPLYVYHRINRLSDMSVFSFGIGIYNPSYGYRIKHYSLKASCLCIVIYFLLELLEFSLYSFHENSGNLITTDIIVKHLHAAHEPCLKYYS